MLSRVKDIILEDHRESIPIEGYEKVPLVPLEQAVQPLVSLFPGGSLLLMVQTVRARCTNPTDGLSPDESASIMLYTTEWPIRQQSLYHILNDVLRQGSREMLEPWFSYLKLLIDALLQLPAISDTVFRGVKGHLSDEYQLNSKLTWWCLSSCTDNVQPLESDLFCGIAGPRTILHIKCLAGRNIKRHSSFVVENEVLLLPGCYLEVVGRYGAADGLQIIQLEEKNPSRDPLKSHPVKPWRRVSPGISLLGTCTHSQCNAYRKEVIIPIDFRGYDIVADSSLLSTCPICSQYVSVFKLGFNHCHWSLHGIKQTNPLSPPMPFKQESRQAPRYSMVEYDLRQSQVTWRQFIAEAQPINST